MTRVAFPPRRTSGRLCAARAGFFAILCGISAPAQEPSRVPEAAAGASAAPVLAPPGASGGALIPEQASFDVERYELDVRVDPTARTLHGTCRMIARATAPLRSLALDLDEPLAVRGVKSGERALEFRREGGRVYVDLGAEIAAETEIDVAVEYGGTPRVAPNPPWKGGFTWSQTPDGKPWIATSCQGEGADLWWPCKDHPSDKPQRMELRVTVPEGLFCASNGVLVSDVPADAGWRTQTWRLDMPFSNYVIALNIAPYEVVSVEYESTAGTKMPVSFWCLPENKEKARAVLPEFLQQLRFFEELLGPYAFRAAKYGVVETPHLGMEHQTIIAYGAKFRRSPPGYDWLHHHELSHEWWGNLVTCRDWKDMWIHEGFGTYMQALYLEKTFGVDAYRKQMLGQSRFGNRRPIAPRESRDSHQIYFGDDGGPSDSDIYYKGAWVLHTLRWLIGDESFFQTLREFCYPDAKAAAATDGSCVRLVDTEDYIALVEKRSGQKLDWFFELYLRQPHLPRLVVERKDAEVSLRWDAPGGLAFPMPVPIELGGKDQRLQIGKDGAKLTVPADAELRIDPNSWVLRAK